MISAWFRDDLGIISVWSRHDLGMISTSFSPQHLVEGLLNSCPRVSVLLAEFAVFGPPCATRTCLLLLLLMSPWKRPPEHLRATFGPLLVNFWWFWGKKRNFEAKTLILQKKGPKKKYGRMKRESHTWGDHFWTPFGPLWDNFEGNEYHTYTTKRTIFTKL